MEANRLNFFRENQKETRADNLSAIYTYQAFVHISDKYNGPLRAYNLQDPYFNYNLVLERNFINFLKWSIWLMEFFSWYI